MMRLQQSYKVMKNSSTLSEREICSIFLEKILPWDILVSRKYLHFLHQNVYNLSKLSDIKFSVFKVILNILSNANANANVLPDRTFLHFPAILSFIPRNPEYESHVVSYAANAEERKQSLGTFFTFALFYTTLQYFLLFVSKTSNIYLFKMLHKADLPFRNAFFYIFFILIMFLPSKR